MKVILNKDHSPLGEEGDVKEVARGYARNYLLPKRIALPYNEGTIRLFAARKEEIEERKAEKRRDASGLREKLEALDLVITMPAGANGRLYGAVTSQTVAEEFSRQGFQIERKRVELPGNTVKTVGKFKVTVKLYESASAEVGVNVQAQQIKVEPRTPTARRGRRQEEAAVDVAAAAESAAASAADTAVDVDATVVAVAGSVVEESTVVPVLNVEADS
jgi:large subunit ribosomal protein L9